MSGEQDLEKLLAGLTPTLEDELYVFATLTPGTELTGLTPLMQFTEKEGVTLILSKSEVEKAGLAYEFPCRRITLCVHSALDAAGMMAAVSTALAEKDIPVNPVAGFYHDHLFVPAARAAEAIRILAALAENSADGLAAR